MKYLVLLVALSMGLSILHAEVGQIHNEDPADGGFAFSPEHYDPYHSTESDAISIDSWTQKANAPIGGGRCSGGIVLVGSEYRLYVFGGFSNAHEYYSLTSETWTSAAAPQYSSNNANFCVIDNKIYVLGSYGSYHRHVTVFDPATDTWSYPTDIPTTYCGSYWYRGAAFPIGRGKILLTDGRTSISSRNTVSVVYDTASDSWTQVASIPANHTYPTSAWFSGYGYVISGLYGGATTVHRYNPSTDTWTSGPNLPSPGKYSRSSTGVNGNGLFVMGGSTTGARNVYVLLTGTTAWQSEDNLPSAYTTGVSPIGGGYNYNLVLACGGNQSGYSKQCWIGTGHQVGFTTTKSSSKRQLPKHTGFTNIGPNPFKGKLRIGYKVEKCDHLKEIEISLYSVSGRKITTVLKENRAEGHHGKMWIGSLPSGVYVVRMTMNGRHIDSKNFVCTE